MSNTMVDVRKCRRCGVKVMSQYLTNGLCRGCRSDLRLNKPNTRVDPDIYKAVSRIKL